jgi:hypothetical protein
MVIVKYALAGVLRMLVLTAGVCSGQLSQFPDNRPNFIEIKLPTEANSESVFIRYALTGDQLGGWVQPRSGVSSYFIDTTRGSRSASRIKAVLYAPGCAIQTLDMPLSNSLNEQYSFICRPLGTIWVTGQLDRRDWLYEREIELDAKYLARWAQSFLGLGDEVLVTIPVGDPAYLAADGHFRIPIPDFSKDPQAGAPDHGGEIQIWAKEKTSGRTVSQLIPAGGQSFKTRMGGLKVQSQYPLTIVFCAVKFPQRHDPEGFALRPGPSDACDR